ncbi:unnamed protein product [Brugia timori]|uniref:Uncharacterized protein n=1 Tax=Brugia timori TaxID=42155 RepID=A0A3P7T8V3_9BILA|nr:unnamed protein product [Brugia timori]
MVGCFSETISRCKLIREKGKVIFKVCDGLDDCGDYSDETNCNCSIMKRVGETMQCKVYTRGETTKCILFSQRCDGYEDCPDGEDERNCEKCINPNAVYCEPTKTCLVSTKRCDGVSDCPDNNDEQRCSCAGKWIVFVGDKVPIWSFEKETKRAVSECQKHGFPIYMCTNAAKCFRRHEVCNPYTQCPNASKVDKLFCASQARQNAFFAVKKV